MSIADGTLRRELSIPLPTLQELLAMTRRISFCAVAFLALAMAGTPASRSFAEGTSYTITSFSDLEKINAIGDSTYQPSALQVYVAGVVINNPGDMLDSAYVNSGPDVVNRGWQVFIQALPAGTYTHGTTTITAPAGDFGGTAVYMGLADWSAGTYPPPALYAKDVWDAKVQAANYPTGSNGNALKYGDVVLVQANAPGMFYNGKYNINEQHSGDPTKTFAITILERGATPAVTPIDLAAVKHSDGSFIFDATQATGAEHYQGSLVKLTGVTLDGGVASLANDAMYTIHQNVGGKDYTFDMLLGLDNDLTKFSLADLKKGFDVTGILDQDDGDKPYTGGYRLWVTNASEIKPVPEPGTVALLATGLAALGRGWFRRKR
jgi:hypothetical protein